MRTLALVLLGAGTTLIGRARVEMDDGKTFVVRGGGAVTGDPMKVAAERCAPKKPRIVQYIQANDTQPKRTVFTCE